MTDTPKQLASFENFQIDRLTPQQKSDMALHLTKAGFNKSQVESIFGPRDPKLSPTEAEAGRKEMVAHLRQYWTGDKAALESAIAKAGLSEI